VELLSVRAAGNAWMSKRPGHQIVPHRSLFSLSLSSLSPICCC
jgi:hypothetical protein